MKKIILILSLTLLSNGLLGCQQSSGTENNNDNISKQNETTENEITNENYDIEGIVTEVSSENKGVLLDLTEKGNERAEQMWFFLNENTKISNKNEETVRFENLKPKIKLRANLSKCIQPAIPQCSAKEIVILN
ncbi:hypothetical protein PVA17_03210 [Lysinibacillus sp. CNPSo 3705]|uniref:hypothetical protein n=1 Tax=Lysinibacillus sp. CNPSo 3705 TaxID=3028148 RepID=UPI002364A059|nr:hypothetical protein [Lysinibacillus sp. CNPSo 3705]MDD1501779.1 hypothetical protein [Lysinibacillus sp. CNPSo 3705]